MLARPQDSARDQLQDETAAVEDYGVAGVVASRASRDVIEGCGEIVDDLALPFVAPLRSHHNDRLHRPVAPARIYDPIDKLGSAESPNPARARGSATRLQGTQNNGFILGGIEKLKTIHATRG